MPTEKEPTQTQLIYYEYLKTAKWTKKRDMALKRDGYRCRLCDSDDSVLHVHHRKYPKEYGKEPQSDLITLCKKCHDLFHFRLYVQQNSFKKENINKTACYKPGGKITNGKLNSWAKAKLINEGVVVKKDARAIKDISKLICLQKSWHYPVGANCKPKRIAILKDYVGVV